MSTATRETYGSAASASPSENDFCWIVAAVVAASEVIGSVMVGRTP